MNGEVTFNNLPEAVAMLLMKVEKLERLLTDRAEPEQEAEDRWLSLEELTEYLPGKPKPNTIYGWVSARKIPFYKKGKTLSFRQSEINAWLTAGRVLTMNELEAEAERHVKGRRGK